MRFLCLHGSGTNNQIFEAQTATLRNELGDGHTYEFVEAVVPWEMDPVVTSLAAPGYDTYTWFDPSDAGTIHKALEDLRQYIISEGPFDALLSFSQGGCLGAMLILDESRRRLRPPPFSCAIFLSWSIWHPELSYLSEVFNSVSEEDKISIPTTHILGKNDTYVRGYEKTVRDFCRPETSSIYMHNSGHEVPRGFDLTQAIQHIRRTIDLVSADRVNGNV